MRRKPGFCFFSIIIPFHFLLIFWPIVCQYLFGLGFLLLFLTNDLNKILSYF